MKIDFKRPSLFIIVMFFCCEDYYRDYFFINLI
jgi:hypothetical protein